MTCPACIGSTGCIARQRFVRPPTGTSHIVSSTSSSSQTTSHDTSYTPSPSWSALPLSAARQHQNQVTFHTSSIRGAATTAAVRFQLSDAAGVTTGPVRVPAGDSAFQRGGTDSFSFDLMRLGQLAKLAVWHDGCDEGSAWHLHHVEVLREGGAGQVRV